MELQEAPLPAPKVADKEAEPGVHAAGEKAAQPKPRSQLVSQITPPSTEPGKATPSSQMGFKRIVSGKGQGLTLGCIEVHADCRGSLLPDPVHDAVRAVVLSVTDDDEEVPDGQFFTRILMYDGPPGITRAEGAEPTTPASSSSHKGFSIDGLPGLQIERFPTEKALLDAVITAVQSLDPDILMGYEVQKGSLGYLSDRAAAAYEWPTFLRELSRLPGSPSANEAPGSDQYGWQHASGLHVAGRIVLNVWRLMRGGGHHPLQVASQSFNYYILVEP